MSEEVGQGPHRAGTGLAVSPRPDAEPDVGAVLLSGKDPAVSGERMPGRRVPQHDGREIDHLRQVGAHGKTPQNPVRIHETRGRGDFARRPVGADHEVGVDRLSAAQPVADDPSLLFERLLRPPDEGGDPRFDRGLVQHGVERRPRDRRAVAGIRQAVGTREAHPATGGTDDQHVADVTPDRPRQPEVAQQLEAAGPDHVAAGLVPWEGRFVDQGDTHTTPSEHESGHAARRSAAYDEHVKAGPAHAAPSTCSDLQ